VFAPGGWLVRVRVPERRLVDIDRQGVTRIRVAGHPSREFAGRIVSVDPARAADDQGESEAARLDPTLRPRAFYIAVIEVSDPGGELRAGLSARLRLPSPSRSLGSHAARWLARFVGERLWI
jgi:hypothetical protein